MSNDVIIRIESMIYNHMPGSTQSKSIIFEVDDHLRQVNEKDYEPQLVAIGPIHHGKDHVKHMEQNKVRYLQQLLQRIAELSIDKFVVRLKKLEQKARLCYSTSFDVLDQDAFVEMLLLDGCFVIELVRKCWNDDLRDKNDPIFRFDQTLSQLRHDLMLFENQLPFFVLNELFNMTKTQDPDDNITSLVHLFVRDMFPWLDVSKSHQPSNPDHLLGLVYQTCFSFSSNNIDGHKENNINSASELKEAGIQFKGSKKITLSGVSFVDGVIKLPPLNVYDKTESLLRNLIAYEQCSLPNDHPKYVTDYAFFMHCLINSTKDIEVLRLYGILGNSLGSDEMIHHMFNRLGKNVLISSNFSYSYVFNNVNIHCRLRRKKWMAKLKRNYFNSPWATVSFLAAAILLLLTSTQTVLSILTYKRRK